jgi:hypothetical protein
VVRASLRTHGQDHLTAYDKVELLFNRAGISVNTALDGPSSVTGQALVADGRYIAR